MKPTIPIPEVHSLAPAERRFSRRNLLLGANALLGSGLAAKWIWNHQEAYCRAPVVVAKAASYAANLVSVLRDGLRELGIGPDWAKGKSVLLKPNLVEPTVEAPHINTHPMLVRAAAELFRSWDAREVFVAEGQGHCRDSDLVLEQSGIGPVLHEAKIPFIDLNHDDVFVAENRLGFTSLQKLYLPQALRRADVVVSLPKLKTHHIAGVTLSMKNLFGVLPGICYGWPKNVLHHAGIPQSILDITATVQPHLAIVDGIVGMEGDGPIMGTAKPVGALVLGRNLAAVDATATRLMGFDPWRIKYLAAASGRLGPIAETHIEQRGESLATLAQSFKLPPAFRAAHSSAKTTGAP